jgi:hypothetical protein
MTANSAHSRGGIEPSNLKLIAGMSFIAIARLFSGSASMPSSAGSMSRYAMATNFAVRPTSRQAHSLAVARIADLRRRANNRNGVSIENDSVDTGRQFSFFVDMACTEGSIY